MEISLANKLGQNEILYQSVNVWLDEKLSSLVMDSLLPAASEGCSWNL
jgi:hypothetical protein